MNERNGKSKTSKETIEERNNNIELDFALKALGYLMPITKEEIDAFDEVNGRTKHDLPADLIEPDFLLVEKKAIINNPDKTERLLPLLTSFKKSNVNNDYFKKLVLAAEIAYQLHNEPTFGHIKFVKIFCLCNEVGGMQLTTNYGKYAAGPLDPKLMRTIDAEFKKRNWFKLIKRDSYGYQYVPLDNVEDYKKYFPRYFGLYEPKINHIISLFRKMKTDNCEIVATLFFVWKDLLKTKTTVNIETLSNGFYAWDEKKKRFDKTLLSNAFEWMKENQIIPIK